MIILTLILSIHAFADKKPAFTIEEALGKNYKCKEIKVKASDGCNSCFKIVCTNGKEQYKSEITSCTAMICIRPIETEKHSPEDWPECKGKKSDLELAKCLGIDFVEKK